MSKRGNGEGSIYQLADGRWRGAISVGWKGGKQKRKTITAKTRTEVANRLKKLLADQDRGINIVPEKQTVSQYLGSWLQTARSTVREKTYRSYEQMVRNHLDKSQPEVERRGSAKRDAVPGLGMLKLLDLSTTIVQRWLNEKFAAGNSPQLVSYLRIVLRAALASAVEEELLRKNFAASAKPPLVEIKEVAPFTPEEASRLLMAARGHRLEALFTCAIAIGLRSGEIAALRWSSDVNLRKCTISIHHTLQRHKGKGLVLVPPKSDKGRRTISLPIVCVSALERHRQLQEAERLLAGSRWVESDHVFTSSIGTPIDDRRILAQFDKLVRDAGLRKQRFHDLRHLAVTLLAAQGVPAKVIADIVGHSDIRFTQNVYQHVLQAGKQDAADRTDAFMDQLLKPQSGVATSVATKPGSDSVN